MPTNRFPFDHYSGYDADADSKFRRQLDWHKLQADNDSGYDSTGEVNGIQKKIIGFISVFLGYKNLSQIPNYKYSPSQRISYNQEQSCWFSRNIKAFDGSRKTNYKEIFEAGQKESIANLC